MSVASSDVTFNLAASLEAYVRISLPAPWRWRPIALRVAYRAKTAGVFGFVSAADERHTLHEPGEGLHSSPQNGRHGQGTRNEAPQKQTSFIYSLETASKCISSGAKNDSNAF